jgi:AraC family transcriptional regulator
MSYRIEEKGTMRMVGIRVPLTQDMEENQKKVPLFWDEIMENGRFLDVCELDNLPPLGILGITTCQNINDIYYYIAASTDKAVPELMHEISIPAATWVIFENSGQFKESIQSIFKRFLSEWLPFSGYYYAELPDLEIYQKGDKSSMGGHFEVWIAVKKERNES